MSSVYRLLHPGRLVLAGAAALLSIGIANAQSPASGDGSHAATVSATESSSTESNFMADGNDANAGPALPAASGGGQYDNKASNSGWKGRVALEAGGGFNVPESDTSPYLHTGYQLNLGGGLHLSKMISMLIEYQFLDDGLPSNIAAQAGVDGGDVHLWSFTMAPVVNLMPHHNTGVYVTGGGGFYRKVTSFKVDVPQEFCTYFYCGIGFVPQTVGTFSSNQGGWNIGGGVSHRFAGAYGDGKMAIYAEGRYLDVLSPAINNQSPNGLGNTTIGEGTKLIPVSFGIRF